MKFSCFLGNVQWMKENADATISMYREKICTERGKAYEKEKIIEHPAGWSNGNFHDSMRRKHRKHL